MTLHPDAHPRARERWRATTLGTHRILSPRVRLFIAVSLIALAVGAPWRVRAQFASGVNLIEVYATVTDARGAAVSGLTAADFRVEQDGVPQQIQTFAAGDMPLAIAVAVDRSFSLSRDRLAQSVRAAQQFVGQLRPDDRVMLLAIGSEVETLLPLSNDHRRAYDALQTLTRWGTTPLYDAAMRAIEAVQPAHGRRALVLLTDGDDRYSRATPADMIADARRHDVLVYIVALRRSTPSVFTELAAVTGGRATAASSPSGLEHALNDVADALRAQYLIGYVPVASGSAEPGWRSISVRVTRPGVRVRARDGYEAR